MPTRVQLPVWSPVTVRSVTAGAVGLLRANAARAELGEHLRSHFRTQHAVLTDSGTSALAVALAAAAGSRGSLPVALPAYSCWDLASAAAAAGVRVRLYDVDPATLAPDCTSLRAALHAGVSAVVVAHLYGMPAPLADTAADVHAAGALLVEDVAQAFGAATGGRPVGCAGDMTVLSFGRGKGLTGGRGGALLARNDASLLDALPVQAAASGAADIVTLAALWMLGRPALYSLPASLPRLRLGETVYCEPHAPARQTGASAAAVNAAWEASLVEVGVRRRNAARLESKLPQAEAIVATADAQPSYLRLPLRVSDNLIVDGDAGARRLGIFRGYPVALCDLPQLTDRLLGGGPSFSGARELARRLVTLPTHSRLRDADLFALEAWIARRRVTRYETAAVV